ncbi:unnamed protein product, partial [Ilex paraguariensis]
MQLKSLFPQQVATPNASELSKSQHSELISRVETQLEHTSLQQGIDCQAQKPNSPIPSWSQVLKSSLDGEASKTFNGTQIAGMKLKYYEPLKENE